MTNQRRTKVTPSSGTSKMSATSLLSTQSRTSHHAELLLANTSITAEVLSLRTRLRGVGRCSVLGSLSHSASASSATPRVPAPSCGPSDQLMTDITEILRSKSTTNLYSESVPRADDRHEVAHKLPIHPRHSSSTHPQTRRFGRQGPLSLYLHMIKKSRMQEAYLPLLH